MKHQNIRLGFSTGVLYKTHRTKDALKIMRNLGYDIVELGFVKLSRIEEGWLEEISDEDLKGFNYISFHAPKFNYGDNDGTRSIFEKIEKINKIRKLNTVVVHPDPVENFEVFRNVSFHVSFENMDNRKISHKTPEDFDIFTKNSGYGLVLDVNHIYSNDPSMALAKDFYNKFGDKITQIHLSGYVDYHDPLFRTMQKEIISSIQNFETPLIIESVLSTEKELNKERDYILNVISELNQADRDV